MHVMSEDQHFKLPILSHYKKLESEWHLWVSVESHSQFCELAITLELEGKNQRRQQVLECKKTWLNVPRLDSSSLPEGFLWGFLTLHPIAFGLKLTPSVLHSIGRVRKPSVCLGGKYPFKVIHDFFSEIPPRILECTQAPPFETGKNLLRCCPISESTKHLWWRENWWHYALHTCVIEFLP